MGVYNEIILWISVITHLSKREIYGVLCATFSFSIRSVSVLASDIGMLPRPDITSLPTEFFLSSAVALGF